MAWALTNLGNASCALGDHQASARYFNQAVQLALALHAIPRALDALSGMAILLAQRGDHERAVERAALCLHHPASQKQTQIRAARLLAQVAEQLSAEAIAAAQERGRAKRLAEAAEV